MRFAFTSALIGGLAVAFTTPAPAAVLCRAKSGSIEVRQACKKKEVQVDLEQRCAQDAVPTASICMDKFEASVWRVPNPTTTNAELVAKIGRGTATVADLEAGSATPLGKGVDNYAPCADNGQNCANDIYAVSLPGVIPSGSITWFQAQVACKNARKRLPSNAEWQAAVVGTPDPGTDNGTTDCSSASGTILTGSRSGCVSSDGAFDMVGNLYEMVADWHPKSLGCHVPEVWSEELSPTDQQCLTREDDPSAVMRGGFGGNNEGAGPLAINTIVLKSSISAVGFRCAR